MGKDRLIVINRERSKLPYDLPPNLVYWIRCETRFKPVDATSTIIKEDELNLFYQTRVTLIDKVSSDISIIKASVEAKN